MNINWNYLALPGIDRCSAPNIFLNPGPRVKDVNAIILVIVCHIYSYLPDSDNLIREAKFWNYFD